MICLHNKLGWEMPHFYKGKDCDSKRLFGNNTYRGKAEGYPQALHYVEAQAGKRGGAQLAGRIHGADVKA